MAKSPPLPTVTPAQVLPSLTADAPFLQQARSAKQELIRRLFGVSSQATVNAVLVPAAQNILGVGYGAKVTVGAAVQGEVALRVYVRSKQPLSALRADESIPPVLNGIPTDVVAVGDVAAAYPPPVDCGVSVGHTKITAGTLGCLVQKANVSAGSRYILSNNHVLANCNSCATGDDTIEPGPGDGGTIPIANLSAWEPLQFGGPVNHMDAAIAEVINVPDVHPDIRTIGRIAHPVMLPSLYQSVRKHGRTTLHTVGVIMDVSADLWVGYGVNRAWFEDQIAVAGVGGVFSAPGDSGSLIVDAVKRQPVGLLFAGGIALTFANPITPILARFNVEIL
jgi:hypothetical protein